MQALKKPLFLVLVVALSCEIEDKYSNPDRSEHLGTKIYTTNNVPAALLSLSENTNEIIVVGFDGIAAIEATSKKVRKLPIAASNFPTQTAWVVGNTIYQFNSNGELSRVDESIVARNETTGADIGEWKSIAAVFGDGVSPSGNHIITVEEVCENGNITSGYCPTGAKMKHSIVDVNTSVEVPMAYTINSSIYLRAFSPDEKNFAIATYDNSVYITEPQD